MKDFTKPPGGIRPLIRQEKGMGMNLGMAKPRKNPMMPRPYMYKPPRVKGPNSPVSDATIPSGGSKASGSGSYLPSGQYSKGGKVQAMTYGKGHKVISCKNY